MTAKKNITSKGLAPSRPTPIVTLHEGYIRVILNRKIIAIDLESEEVEQFNRKARTLIGA